jgi:hypothetical protein
MRHPLTIAAVCVGALAAGVALALCGGWPS